LESGKYFRNMGFDSGANINILSARIAYAKTKEDSCVPYCCFKVQQGSDSEVKEIMIPLLANG
ncbi:MAG: hypothetical protein IJ471_05550, partial [Eubacterium sp.]|nr:hypothetical protein [Eubacterium sp.]